MLRRLLLIVLAGLFGFGLTVLSGCGPQLSCLDGRGSLRVKQGAHPGTLAPCSPWPIDDAGQAADQACRAGTGPCLEPENPCPSDQLCAFLSGTGCPSGSVCVRQTALECADAGTIWTRPRYPPILFCKD